MLQGRNSSECLHVEGGKGIFGGCLFSSALFCGSACMCLSAKHGKLLSRNRNMIDMSRLCGLASTQPNSFMRKALEFHYFTAMGRKKSSERLNYSHLQKVSATSALNLSEAVFVLPLRGI